MSASASDVEIPNPLRASDVEILNRESLQFHTNRISIIEKIVEEVATKPYTISLIAGTFNSKLFRDALIRYYSTFAPGIFLIIYYHYNLYNRQFKIKLKLLILL